MARFRVTLWRNQQTTPTKNRKKKKKKEKKKRKRPFVENNTPFIVFCRTKYLFFFRFVQRHIKCILMMTQFCVISPQQKNTQHHTQTTYKDNKQSINQRLHTTPQRPNNFEVQEAPCALSTPRRAIAHNHKISTHHHHQREKRRGTRENDDHRSKIKIITTQIRQEGEGGEGGLGGNSKKDL